MAFMIYVGQEIYMGVGYLLRGGFMMIPLLASGFIALVVVIERLWILKRKFATPNDLVCEILDHARSMKVLRIENSELGLSPVMHVLAAGLKDPSAPVDEVELSMQNEAERWIFALERRLGILDTIITAAPLMGLLGTITGMMASFQVLSEKGVNEPGAITGGVAEALIATATGLVIALVCLVAFNYLNEVVKTYIGEIENTSSSLLEARKAARRLSL